MAPRRVGADALLIARSVSDFLHEHAPHAQGRSPHTVKSYSDSITLYLLFLEGRGVTPDGLDRSHFERRWIEEWIAWLKSERGCTNDTCNVRLSGIRAFLDYLGTRDAALRYLFLEAKQIKRQRAGKRKVDGMSLDAIEALLAAPGTSTRIGRRDTCFLTLAYSTACRLDEVRRLTVGQLHLDDPKPHMTVTGKGGKTRTCYLVPKAVSVARAYMRDELGPDPSPSDLLFPSSHGGGPMTEQAWDSRIKKHASSAHLTCVDVPEKAHFHQLRHAKASHWLGEDKLNVIEVQHLLGHEQLETTMRYIDFDDGSLVDAVTKLEGEKERGAEKKWHKPDATLRDVCGLGRGRQAHPGPDGRQR